MKATFVVLFCLLAMATAAMVPQDMDEYSLKDFENFIKRFGKDALHFLECMGPTFITHCGKETTSCLTHALAHDFLNCLQLLKCEGKDVSNCMHHLHDATTPAL